MKKIYFLTINQNNTKRNGFKKEFTNLSKLKKYVSKNHFKDQANISCNFNVCFRYYKHANSKTFYSIDSKQNYILSFNNSNDSTLLSIRDYLREYPCRSDAEQFFKAFG